MVVHSKTLGRITKLPVFSHTEMRKVNYLIQKALLSSNLQQRLLDLDSSLQAEFGLPTHVWTTLSEIKASSIADFCGEVSFLQDDIAS